HGRADVRARRRRAAIAHGADQGAAGAARLRRHLRDARHVARESLLRPAARDVRGPGGRAVGDADPLRPSAPPLLAGAAHRLPLPPGPDGRAAGDPRPPPRSRGPAGRLSLRAALPAGAVPLHRRRGTALPGEREPRSLRPARDRPVNEPLLRTEGLTRHFRVGKLTSRQTLHAVDDVDLSIGRSEIVALVGESGSGKSTIARLLALVY